MRDNGLAYAIPEMVHWLDRQLAADEAEARAIVKLHRQGDAIELIRGRRAVIDLALSASRHSLHVSKSTNPILKARRHLWMEVRKIVVAYHDREGFNPEWVTRSATPKEKLDLMNAMVGGRPGGG